MSAVFEAKADVKDEADDFSWDKEGKWKTDRFPVSSNVSIYFIVK